MTHDELLAKIDGWTPAFWSIQDYKSVQNIARLQHSALRAVVELHKPNEYGRCLGCPTHGSFECGLETGCPTIQAIEKELN